MLQTLQCIATKEFKTQAKSIIGRHEEPLLRRNITENNLVLIKNGPFVCNVCFRQHSQSHNRFLWQWTSTFIYSSCKLKKERERTSIWKPAPSLEWVSADMKLFTVRRQSWTFCHVEIFWPKVLNFQSLWLFCLNKWDHWKHEVAPTLVRI